MKAKQMQEIAIASTSPRSFSIARKTVDHRWWQESIMGSRDIYFFLLLLLIMSFLNEWNLHQYVEFTPIYDTIEPIVLISVASRVQGNFHMESQHF